jgi:uncharacterized protein (DUF1330 family)
MAAYLIAEVEVTDPAAFEEYRKLVPATLAAYGGKFVARGGAVTPLEGGWNPKRIVVLEFESAAKAKQWYDSEEYAKPKAMRQKSSNGKLIIVDGV